MKQLRNILSRLKGENGYSLAELLVSVAIATFTIIALVVMLQKGSEVTETGSHRERARALIDSCFEGPEYRYLNYQNINNGTASRQVLIDGRDTSKVTDNLTGTLTVNVITDSQSVQGAMTAFKKLTASVAWAEPEGQQTITVVRQVTEL